MVRCWKKLALGVCVLFLWIIGLFAFLYTGWDRTQTKYIYIIENSFKIVSRVKQFKNSLNGINQALSIQLRAKEFICTL